MTTAIEFARSRYDSAADEVDRTLDIIEQRIARLRKQIADAREDKPIALDEPEWISQDALKVTVAISNYAAARREFGYAVMAEAAK